MTISVAIRVDSSINMGSGHLMRCLTLADKLKENGGNVVFICRNLPGNLSSLVKGKGYFVYRLMKDESVISSDNWMGTTWEHDAEETLEVLGETIFDWFIVDHYSIDARWENLLRPLTRQIMIIDDLANRPHCCDVLLDQNLYENMKFRYDRLVPSCSVKLLGPHYAMLRKEFIKARANLRVRDGDVRRILVFFGGSDPTNETTKALKAIQSLNRVDIAVDAVAGAENPWRNDIKSLCSKMPNVVYHCQVENMAELMVLADLSIGAGGSTMWERCCLGLPTLIITIADNQIETTKYLDASGLAWFCGNADSVSIVTLAQRVSYLLDKSSALHKVSERCKTIVDGAGCDRVATLMMQYRSTGVVYD